MVSLKNIQSHIRWLDVRFAEIDGKKVAAMQSYKEQWQLSQTIPGMALRSRAMLLAEIRTFIPDFYNKEPLS